MDDPKAIAARYGTVAKKIVDDATKAVDAAYGKINKVDENNKTADQGPFTASDAIATMGRLWAVAATGAIDFARIPLQLQSPRGPMLLADHIATVAAVAISDAGQVAEDLAKSLADDTSMQNQQSQVIESAIKLTTIGMLRGAEVLETVVAGPGRYRDPMVTSDPFPIDSVERDRVLTVERLGRAAIPEENIAALVEVVGNDGVLERGESSFRLRVNAAGIPSGVFIGLVQPHEPGTKKADGEPVTVSLAL